MVKITVGIEGMCEAHINEAVRNAFQIKKVSSSHTKKQTVIIAEKDIPFLAQDFRVVCVFYYGFDETEKSFMVCFKRAVCRDL